MTPLQQTTRFEGSDNLIHLGILTIPAAADALAAAAPGALQHLDLTRPLVPLGQTFRLRDDVPNTCRRGCDASLSGDLDYGMLSFRKFR